jgi:hypothetical protein
MQYCTAVYGRLNLRKFIIASRKVKKKLKESEGYDKK